MSPLFEYRCPADGCVFELFRNTSKRDAPARCPECGKRAEPILSAPQLKPDGAYSFNDR